MRSRWFGLVIAAVAVAVSIWAYPRLPPTVAMHWDLRGAPDGFSSRLLAVSIVPVVLLVMTGLYNVLPKLDPRGENYAKFLSTYWLIGNAVIVFVLVAHAMIIASGLGYSVRIDRLMPLGFFVGIRTPWTLSSDTVWRKTHRTGGWLMVLGGFVLAVGAFILPHGAFLPLFVTTIVIVALIPIVQSYVLWKREQGKP